MLGKLKIVWRKPKRSEKVREGRRKREKAGEGWRNPEDGRGRRRPHKPEEAGEGQETGG